MVTRLLSASARPLSSKGGLPERRPVLERAVIAVGAGGRRGGNRLSGRLWSRPFGTALKLLKHLSADLIGPKPIADQHLANAVRMVCKRFSLLKKKNLIATPLAPAIQFPTRHLQTRCRSSAPTMKTRCRHCPFRARVRSASSHRENKKSVSLAPAQKGQW